MPLIIGMRDLPDGIAIDTTTLGTIIIDSTVIPQQYWTGNLADAEGFLRQLIAGWIAVNFAGFSGSYDIHVNSLAVGALSCVLIIANDPNYVTDNPNWWQ
jgi:hypothetical protein